MREPAGPRPRSRLGLGSIRDPRVWYGLSARRQDYRELAAANLAYQCTVVFCPVQSRARSRRTGWRRIGEAKYVACDIMATSTLHRQQQKTGSVSLTAVSSEIMVYKPKD